MIVSEVFLWGTILIACLLVIAIMILANILAGVIALSMIRNRTQRDANITQ